MDERSEEDRNRFHGVRVRAAWAILDEHGCTDDHGVINIPANASEHPDVKLALSYLCDEWDYDYIIIN